MRILFLLAIILSSTHIMAQDSDGFKPLNPGVKICGFADFNRGREKTLENRTENTFNIYLSLSDEKPSYTLKLISTKLMHTKFSNGSTYDWYYGSPSLETALTYMHAEKGCIANNNGTISVKTSAPAAMCLGGCGEHSAANYTFSEEASESLSFSYKKL